MHTASSFNPQTKQKTIMDVFRKKKTIMDYFKPLKPSQPQAEETCATPLNKQPTVKASTMVFEQTRRPEQKTAQYFVFTDGSQIRENRTHKSLSVSWAYVIKRRDGSVVHRDSGELPKSETNQRAELLSIHNAVKWCDRHLSDPVYDLNVYSDSDYSIKCLTLWVHSWKKSDWKNANKKPVKHKDIIEACFDLMGKLRRANRRVLLTHIRSHTNKTDFFATGNAEADQMASHVSKQALARQRAVS